MCILCQQTSLKSWFGNQGYLETPLYNLLETWIWHQIVTSQRPHTTNKWPPYTSEWTPPHENFLRTPLQRKPGETIPGLAARIRQDAATCDFASIRNPLDEALRTRLICSVDNEAVSKAVFKTKDDELDFARAIEVATETGDAAKVAKETLYEPKPKAVHKVQRTQNSTGKRQVSDKPDARQSQKCYRCGKITIWRLPFQKRYLQFLQAHRAFGNNVSQEGA